MTGGELKEIKLPHCSDNTASSLLLIAVRPSQVIFGRKFGDGAEVGKYEVKSKNGANGMSDIEGKVTRVGARSKRSIASLSPSEDPFATIRLMRYSGCSEPRRIAKP